MNLPKLFLPASFLLVSFAPAQPVVHLKAGAPVSRTSRVLPKGDRPTHFLVRFQAEPGPEIRLELERRGMHVLQYVPDAALLVSSRVIPNLEGLDAVSADPMHASTKISPLLTDRTAGAILVEFYPDVDMAKAREQARAAGFDVLENATLMGQHLVLSGLHREIGALAESDDVAYILPASPELTAGIPVDGCMGATAQAGPVGQYVLMSRGWPKDAAGNVALHYFIQSLTATMDPATARSEIERALREWTRYANFTLTPGQQAGSERSVDILFAHGSHGDQYVFDGPGGAVAHTFYPAPPNPEPIAGDLHLDADELWSIGASIDLYSVALHEAGHALGLGHSDRPGSVMYPYYRLSAGLTDDDIAAIRALYGDLVPASINPTRPPSPTPAPAPTPIPTPTPTSGSPDTTAPSLQIKSPGTNITSNSASTIAVSGIASDNLAVVSVNWTTSAGGAGMAGGTTAWSAAIPLLVGTNVITVRAFDAAGNSAWRSLTVIRR